MNKEKPEILFIQDEQKKLQEFVDNLPQVAVNTLLARATDTNNHSTYKACNVCVNLIKNYVSTVKNGSIEGLIAELKRKVRGTNNPSKIIVYKDVVKLFENALVILMDQRNKIQDLSDVKRDS